MAGRPSQERRPCSRESSNHRDQFAVNVRTRTRMYVVLLHVLAIHQRGTASARDRCPALHAQHAVTPIILNTTFSRGQIS